MKFADFQALRTQLIREQPHILDCAETNLYAALARFKPTATPPSEKTVHRCHLATEWTERFGFPSEASRRALISCGVRDSLGMLFRHYASVKARLWLPSDNYPVYGELAAAAGLEFRQFPTLPEPVWPSENPVTTDEILVITNPVKPLGRWLSDADVSALKEWLAASPRRRVIVDAVYTFETRFTPSTLALIATGQTLLLHSLTKGWLEPRFFGVALVPECDVEIIAPVFRHNPPPQTNLARARDLMANYFKLPKEIAAALSIGIDRLLAELPPRLKPLTLPSAPGYFVPVQLSWSDLLAETKILGLPATVFGSSREDITILSCLNALNS